MPDMHSFRNEQKKFDRVKAAYASKEAPLKKLFAQKGWDWNGFSVLLVAFKEEKQLRVYIKPGNDQRYALLATYVFCVLSGHLGPKRKEGDKQVPEGLYEITHFNPLSRFHLSLRINYPNASDRLRSDPQQPGSDIYIHGSCVSTGCIPITDELISELYVLCVEARNRQPGIPVYIFPFEMTAAGMEAHKNHGLGQDVENLWADLQRVYDEFTQTHDIIRFGVDKKGRYLIGQGIGS